MIAQVARIGNPPQCEHGWRAYASRTQACRWRRRLSEGSGHSDALRWDAALTQTAKASQRRPSQEWRLAPCGSADTRCANLRANFDYVVWALSTNFGTNRPGLSTAEPGAASILKVYRREGSMSGCELCCAPKSGMAPRSGGGHFPRKGCRHPKFSSLPKPCSNLHAPWWARSAERLRRPFFETSATHLSGSQKHSCGCAFYVPVSRRVKIADYVVSIDLNISRSLERSLFTRLSRERDPRGEITHR